MLHIILLILKIIGIILLSVLCLLLLALLLVLFVPARYRGIVHYHDTLYAKGKLSWLLHIISISFIYENEELKQIIRIFGIRFRKREKKPKPIKIDPVSKAEEAPAETEELIGTENSAEAEKSAETEKLAEAEESAETEESEETAKAEASAETEAEANSADASKAGNTEASTEEAPEREKLLSKLKRFFKMLYERIRNIQYTITHIYDNIASIGQKIGYYTDLLQDERNQAVFRLLFGQMGGLLRHVKPRKFRMDLMLGSEDPGTTGSILAILGILYPMFGGGLHVTPYYDRAVFEADVDLRGHITAFVFLRAAWIVYFNQDVKRLLRTLKNKEAV